MTVRSPSHPEPSSTARQRSPTVSSPSRELTARAVITGVLIGALLTPCNVYSGLKIGWSFNMSITALLLAFAVWRPFERLAGTAPWTLLESNINQTAASAAASIISGGLVAPIPALAMIEGHNRGLGVLVPWVFAVSFLGVWVAWYLRPRMVLGGRFAFPAGVATAETLKDVFEQGRESTVRVFTLLGSAVFAGGLKLVDQFVWAIPRWAPGSAAKLYGFQLDPSLLMLGFGTIIGLRAGLSLLLGAVVAWAMLGPWIVGMGWVDASLLANGSFGVLVEWLLWPGVSLMVASTLTSLAARMIWRDPAAAREPPASNSSELPQGTGGGRRSRWPLLGLGAASVLAVLVQVLLFDIDLLMAALAVPLAFVLAAVAARVVGETGIPPIGAIGKVSQLGYGLIAPGQVHTNLLTANVAGGAAGQCADLLNDFKAGAAVGASAGRQVVAQSFGILAGAVVGSAVYLLLIRDPGTQLLTAEWPAPAVATWKAVAETLSQGIGSVPSSARWAMLAGALAGALLGIGEARLPTRYAAWLPSGAAMGLAFVIPASTSLTLFFGAALAWVLLRAVPRWSGRFLLAIAAGFVAGESLAGVVAALFSMR